VGVFSLCYSCRGVAVAIVDRDPQQVTRESQRVIAGLLARHSCGRQKALFNSEAGQSSALALTAASSFIRFLTAGMYG
jgi:hypothetical protein